MDRYLLFAGQVYYASGGWRDYRGSFTDLVIAKLRAEELLNNEDAIFDWYHIVDVDSGEIVDQSETEAYS